MSDSLNLEELKRLILDQQQKIDKLEHRVNLAEKQAEAVEQHSRQDCLILRGKIDIRPNCSIRDEVMRIITFHTGVRFPSWCLNTAHWLGGGKSIIVRFNNKAVRDEVYRNRVPKEVEKRGLFIHESLTASKMALVARCTALRNQGHITTYYTQNGNVLVKKTRSSPSLLITPNMTNENIITKLQNQPNTYREAAARGGHKVEDTNTSTNTTAGGPPTTTENKQNTETNTQKNTEATVQESEETCHGEKKVVSKATLTDTKVPSGDEAQESQTESDSESSSASDVAADTGGKNLEPTNGEEKDVENIDEKEEVKSETQVDKSSNKETEVKGTSDGDHSVSHKTSPSTRLSRRRRNQKKGK